MAPRRRSSWLLIALLVAALAAVDLAVFTAGLDVPRFPHIVLINAWALALSQVSLVSIWAGLSRAWFPVRLAVVVSGIAFLAVMQSWLPDAGERGLWAVLFVCQAILLILPLPFLHGAGLELAHRLLPIESLPAGARWQFSILYLLVWMTALAILLGAIKSLAGPDGKERATPFDWELLDVLIVFIPGRAAVALAALWVVLGTSRRTRAVALLAASSLASWWLLIAVNPDFAGGPAYSALLHLMEAALLVTMLLVVRLAGWRVEWRPTAESAEATERDLPAVPQEPTQQEAATTPAESASTAAATGRHRAGRPDPPPPGPSQD